MATSVSTNMFSPIMLFESTLTNATMLTETMCQTELLTAHQISSRLLNGIMEALHKLSESLAREAECQRALAEAAQVSLAAAKAKVQKMQTQVNFQGNSTSSASRRDIFEDGYISQVAVKSEDTVLRKYVSEPMMSSLSPDGLKCGVKNEIESDDECILLDTLANTSSSLDELQSRKRRMVGSYQNNGATSSNMDPKELLRALYQQMIGNGPHLFDFTKPLFDGLNRSVAMSLIEKAKQSNPKLQLSFEQWQNGLSHLFNNELSSNSIYLMPYNYCRQRHTAAYSGRNSESQHKIANRRWSRKVAKLQRRQKAYTELRKHLSQEEAAKYQYILSRDVTSSDEEIEGADSATRVRLLSWESAETVEMKRRLDATFCERFATDKQQSIYQRCLRDGFTISSRGAPDNAPAWMLKCVPGGVSLSSSCAYSLAEHVDDSTDS